MSEALIREIAEQIVQEQLLQNWVFYAVLLAVLIVGSVASAFIGSYIRKRGETYATKADLAELVAQLRATTQAAEEVKTAIAHTDWTAKEWKTIRRTKIEELVGAVYSLREWLDKETNVRLFGEKAEEREQSPIWKIELVSRLYFPEFKAEAQALSLVYSEYKFGILDIQQKLVAAQKDLPARQVVYDAALPIIRTHHGKLLAAISAFEAKAPTVMKDIVGV